MRAYAKAILSAPLCKLYAVSPQVIYACPTPRLSRRHYLYLSLRLPLVPTPRPVPPPRHSKSVFGFVISNTSDFFYAFQMAIQSSHSA